MSRGTDESERRRRAPVLNWELEVNKHASSLQAIRTEHTQDLTAHLIRYLRHEETITATSANSPQPEHGRQNRDQWTRWPLPDAAQSDWDLEDEIGVIVRRVFLNKHTREDNGGGGIGNHHHYQLDDGEEEYVDQLAQCLTPIMVQFLENILVVIEEHTVLRPQSMQDRINPLNWRDLANILASPALTRDLIDGRMLARYVDRMERFLGSDDSPTRPCTRRAIERRDMLDRHFKQRQILHDRLMSKLF